PPHVECGGENRYLLGVTTTIRRIQNFSTASKKFLPFYSPREDFMQLRAVNNIFITLRILHHKWPESKK
ncbi:hypothetical protein, partial [Corynebacterium sp.]|uniref:hypothetical protein n=1 Tax=Corynebacterium sp. TaxID=1720 RepID=UPI002909160F